MVRFYKNRSIIMVAVAAIIIIVIIALSSMDRGQVSRLESIVGVIIKPATQTLTGVVDSIRSSIAGLAEIGSLKKTNQMLNQQLIALRAQVREIEALRQENQRLREMLDFKNTHSEFDLIGCSIAGKSPDNTSGIFIINKGIENGVLKNMPVVTSKGLVGRVIETANGWAKVLPLNDQRSSVSILVNRTRDTGILKGDISFELTGSISRSGDCRGRRPGHIRYGRNLSQGPLCRQKITGISTDGSQLLKTIRVEPAVDFDKLEEVFVLNTWRNFPLKERR